MAAETTARGQQQGTALRVIDAFDHPHGGRLLRTRVIRGAPPAMSSLRNLRLVAVSPEGSERTVRVLGFPLFGGKVSDARIERTGRVDLHVEEEGEGPSVTLMWELRLDS